MGRLFACFRCCLVAGMVLLGISGAIMAVFAGYFIYQLYEYASITPDNVCESAAVLLTMGVTTCCIGWFAWQFLNFYNRAQVITFAVALGTIALIQSCVGIWALVRHEQIGTLSPERHTEIFALAVKDEKAIWDQMQSALQCCGIDGPNDYRNAQLIPWSCCNRTNSANNHEIEGTCSHIYKRGCQHVVLNRTRSILLHIFLLALCSVLLQISFLACMACYARIYKDKMEKTRVEITRRQQSEKDVHNTDTLLLAHTRKSSDGL